MILGLCTGNRLQTICKIKVSDIKSNGTIKLYDFKNESEYYGFIENSSKDELLIFIDRMDKRENDSYFKQLK